MKLEELVEGGAGSGRPDSGKRPDANLWFQRMDLWMEDLHSIHGLNMEILTTHDSDMSDLFVVDKDSKMCYGVWRKDISQGVSFKKPKSLKMVGDPRTKYVKMADAPIGTQQ